MAISGNIRRHWAILGDIGRYWAIMSDIKLNRSYYMVLAWDTMITIPTEYHCIPLFKINMFTS